MAPSPCIVWEPIKTGHAGTVDYPVKIAEAIDAPIYTYDYPDGLDGRYDVEFRSFREPSLTTKILDRSPLSEVAIAVEYSSWKPPERHDVILTHGPQAVHTIPRIGQRRVHLFDGSYRGFFYQKDRYEAFRRRHPLLRFLLGSYRLRMRSSIIAGSHAMETIVVNSEWTEEVIKKLYNREADAVIYPPLDISGYAPSNADDGDYFLYLGWVDQLHRVEELIDAFSGIDERLKIAGAGSYLQEARRRATDNIEFVGYVNGDEKRELLAGCKALVNPTDHSFGRSIVEALASGSPVVTVDRGFPPMMIEEGVTGTIYQKGAENLARCVEQFDPSIFSVDDIVVASDQYRYEHVVEDWQQLVARVRKQ